MRKLGIQDIVQLNYLLNELCHEKTGYSGYCSIKLFVE